MELTTRSPRIAPLLFLATIAAASACVAQQLGVRQAYPQTAASAPQQHPPASPYPTTSAPQQSASPYPTTSAPAPGALNQPAPTAQPQPQPNAVQQPAAGIGPQMPPGFPLNALEQQSLDAALGAWETQGGKIQTFSCPFDRLEYVKAFGPVINGQAAPLNKNKGELSYSRPDMGSFEIKEISAFQATPVPAGQQPPPVVQGNWVVQPNAIGEHWVCDGKSVYEFRSDQKQVVERPLPPNAGGNALLDGPLPFVFGAKADDLKQRYWMRIDESQGGNPRPEANRIWLMAWPKFQQQAADFKQVVVILDRAQMLPVAMQITLPNNDQHVYVFHINQANVNGLLPRMKQALFAKPGIPFGWKLVVQNAPVQQQAQQPPPAQNR